MSMLTEKRQELTNKLTTLENARNAEIERKVAEYRASLEANTKCEGIEKLKSAVAAIDVVIAYENSADVEVATIKQPSNNVDTSGRPGMENIVTPSRI